MKLTVIIRDDGPFIHVGDSPSYRTVQIELTEDQMKAIKLKHSDEEYSNTILEPKFISDPKG